MAAFLLERPKVGAILTAVDLTVDLDVIEGNRAPSAESASITLIEHDRSADQFARLHRFKSIVDFVQRDALGNHVVQVQPAAQVEFHDVALSGHFFLLRPLR
jgi:hypothetical protein